MESEGPYGHKKYPIAGGGKKHSQSCQACAYAEGRKAAEKEFKELLEIAQSLDDDTGYESAATESFRAWKKARGIE